MSNPELLIQRYVRIRISDDDVWSGIVAQVKSHNKDGTYTVSLDKTKDSEMKLTASRLKVYSPGRFEEYYPNASVIRGRHDMTNIPIGCVIDFSAAVPNTNPRSHQFIIEGPCRVVGGIESGTTGSFNTIDNSVLVVAKERDLVEFENVCFDGSKWDVTCVTGEVVFRSCTFSNRKSSLEVGGDGEPKRARVTFENCTFSNIVRCAVSVSYAFAHFTNCKFNACGMGVVVEEGGYVDVRNSTFRECTGGVNVLDSGEAVLQACLFACMVDFGVLVSNISKLQSISCTAVNCTGSGVVIEGTSAPDALVKAWTFQDCHTGVRISNGDVNVLLELLSFHGCKIGIYITPDAAGEIFMRGTNVENLVDLSGPKCSIYLTEDDEETIRAPQLDRLHASRDLLAANGIKYGYPVSARTRKVLAEAGIMVMVCAMCKAVAPTDNVYKKCAGCSETRYCSRVCQEAHWPVHSIQCRVSNERADKFGMQGYIDCAHCGKVESLTCGKAHNSCGRCLRSFYCSKECQKANWPGHKKLCQKYQER